MVERGGCAIRVGVVGVRSDAVRGLCAEVEVAYIDSVGGSSGGGEDDDAHDEERRLITRPVRAFYWLRDTLVLEKSYMVPPLPQYRVTCKAKLLQALRSFMRRLQDNRGLVENVSTQLFLFGKPKELEMALHRGVQRREGTGFAIDLTAPPSTIFEQVQDSLLNLSVQVNEAVGGVETERTEEVLEGRFLRHKSAEQKVSFFRVQIYNIVKMMRAMHREAQLLAEYEHLGGRVLKSMGKQDVRIQQPCAIIGSSLSATKAMHDNTVARAREHFTYEMAEYLRIAERLLAHADDITRLRQEYCTCLELIEETRTQLEQLHKQRADAEANPAEENVGIAASFLSSLQQTWSGDAAGKIEKLNDELSIRETMASSMEGRLSDLVEGMMNMEERLRAWRGEDFPRYFAAYARANVAFHRRSLTAWEKVAEDGLFCKIEEVEDDSLPSPQTSRRRSTSSGPSFPQPLPPPPDSDGYTL